MGGEPARGLSRLLTSWRVLTVVAIVITALAVLGVQAVQAQIVRRAVAATVLSTQSVNLLVVNRNVTIDDVTGPMSATDRDRMDADLILLKSRGEFVGVQVWALTNGRLIYGDIDHRDDLSRLPRADLVRARQGAPFTRYTDDDLTGLPVLLVFIPFDVDGDGTLDAVSEAMLPRDRIDGSITQYTQLLYVASGLTLALTLAVLWSVGRRQAAQDLAATHDAMTGLGNRALLDRAGRLMITRATEAVPAALLLIDLDGFKGVNDSLGHHAGDELLVAVASQLTRGCRPGDQVIRLGGDEFAVLLGALPERELAERIARDLVTAIREPTQVVGVTIQVGASIGIAYAPDHGVVLDQVLRCADIAMYDAKRNRRDVVRYDASIAPHVDHQLNLLPELRRAITEGELTLHYQPVCRPGQPISRVEALVRWQHPERGLLMADEFVPTVERTSLITQLNAWVIEQAAGQCARWRAAGRPLQVSVNVAGRSLLDGDLLALIQGAVRAAGLPAGALMVEVNERVLLGGGADRAFVALRELTDAGVPVAIDDVGGDYAIMFPLSQLDLAELKIHPRFVADLNRSGVATAMVQYVVSLARHLGARSLAAGVESTTTWARLVDLGCDGGQGYALTPPLPPDQLLDWLDRWQTGPPAFDGRVPAEVGSSEVVRPARFGKVVADRGRLAPPDFPSGPGGP